MGGYSLGLVAPEEDKEDSWFGHGGAWGTNCMVNWHRKELKLWGRADLWRGRVPGTPEREAGGQQVLQLRDRQLRHRSLYRPRQVG